MSVLTEAAIRKLFRESAIVEHGTFEMAPHQKLTPAARGFLNDHHVTILSSAPQRVRGKADQGTVKKEITSLEASAVYPLLFRLTRLYPTYLATQRELYLAFQTEKCQRLSLLLQVLERVATGQVLEELSDYDEQLTSHADLQAIRISKQLDQSTVMMSYRDPAWRLAAYACYTETAVLRHELELVGGLERDAFLSRTCQLLKALEVLLWLVASE